MATTPDEKPRLRFNGWIWMLTPPVARPGFHFQYLSRSPKAAYLHWLSEAESLEHACHQ